MKTVNYKLKIFGPAVSFFAPSALAAGLVPCGGIGQGFCSFCDLFLLIGNVFQFVVGTLVPIIAIAMVVWGGYRILTAGVNPDQIKSARKTLYNTFIGLIIVYGSFVGASYVVGFLAKSNQLAVDYGFHGGVFTVNCTSSAIQDLRNVKLELIEQPSKIEKIKEGELRTDSGQFIGRIDTADDGTVDLKNLSRLVQEGLATAEVDSNLLQQGISLVVTSGYRSVAEQKSVVQSHCVDPNASTCEAKPGKSVACIPQGGGGNCPHTTGNAVDVVGVRNKKACVIGTEVVDKPCQDDVIKAMQNQKFCARLPNEPWHFEKPCGPF